MLKGQSQHHHATMGLTCAAAAVSSTVRCGGLTEHLAGHLQHCAQMCLKHMLILHNRRKMVNQCTDTNLAVVCRVCCTVVCAMLLARTLMAACVIFLCCDEDLQQMDCGRRWHGCLSKFCRETRLVRLFTPNIIPTKTINASQMALSN